MCVMRKCFEIVFVFQFNSRNGNGSDYERRGDSNEFIVDSRGIPDNRKW